jgi:hypothetical protein
MSFNRIKYDDGAYKQLLNESIGPSTYLLGTPNNLDENCEPCYPYPPTTRLQTVGDSVLKDTFMIDVDTELLGLNRKLTKDPLKEYIPCCPNALCKSGLPCGGGVNEECAMCNGSTKRGARPQDHKLKHFKDCMFPQEFTRLSNAPCTLRGTGWNRWEWLCLNPQDKVEIPFDWNIDSRTLAKDNHRPCIPTPLDPTRAYPTGGNLPCQKTSPTCSAFTQPASINWRKCGTISQY